MSAAPSSPGWRNGDALGKRMPALLAMAGYYGTLAAVRSLGQAGVPVHVAEPQRLAPARWSRYVARHSSCPPVEAQPERFVQWLAELGAREPGHVLLPSNDELAWLLARHRSELCRGFKLGVPSFEAVDAVLNKWKLAQSCAAVGVPTPGTWLVENDEDLARLRSEARFPVLVKPQTQVFLHPHSKGLVAEEPGVLAARCRAHVEGTGYASPIRDHDPGITRPLLQAYVESRGGVYGVSGFVDQTGSLFVAAASRKLLSRPRKAGVGLCFEEDELRPQVAEHVRRLCRHVGYHGVFEIEFLEADGRYLLIDFNPRFYGQMSFDVDRGLDLPLLAYLHALGDREAVAAAVERARGKLAAGGPRRVWCNSIQLRTFLALGRLSGGIGPEEARSWRRWMRDQRDRATDAVVSPGDWRPAVAEVCATAWKLLRHPRATVREAA